MSARSWLAASLVCAACSAEIQDRAMMPRRDDGWPVVRAPNSLDSGTIALACNIAEPTFSAWPTDPEGEYRLYAVRNPVCTTNRLKQGRAQCDFEIGETERKIFGDNRVAAARVKRWRPARVSLSYRRVGAEHEWMESWWADGPCRLRSPRG